MNKEKVLKLLKSKIGVGIISGVLCFLLGGVIFSDKTTVKKLKNENSELSSKFEYEISEKDNKIKELQAKVDEAKPWFDKQEKEKRKAEEQAKKEAEEQAKKEVEEQAKKEAQGVNTDEVKQTVDSAINKELNDQIRNTKIESLQVNENLGTDSKDDVVVLANLSWSTKNTEKTTREMLEMYSDHLAAKLAPELSNGSEIALFWKAEYTGLDIKHSYYIKNGNAYRQ